nr:ribosomal protein S4 [Meringosphaera mediterranea]
MSRYRGPKLRLTRRLGRLPGLTTKKPNSFHPPGQHGVARSRKKRSLSDYAIRLNEKQKLRFNYGISEKQLFNYLKIARRLKGATGTNLLQFLEMRLETTVYNLGFASTIPAARQLVNHGHIVVNNKRVNIPSFQCKPSDIISIKDQNQSKALVKSSLESSSRSRTPNHLQLDSKNLIGKVNSIILRKEIPLRVNELLIVEFYSRK